MSEEQENQNTQETLEIKGDRVVYGAGRKISDGNYGSYDFHCSLSTDVKPGETTGQTVNRAIGFVEKVLTHQVSKGTKKGMGY